MPMPKRKAPIAVQATILKYEEKATERHLRYYRCELSSGHIVNLPDGEVVKTLLLAQIFLVSEWRPPQDLKGLLEICSGLKIPLNWTYTLALVREQVYSNMRLVNVKR